MNVPSLGGFCQLSVQPVLVILSAAAAHHLVSQFSNPCIAIFDQK